MRLQFILVVSMAILATAVPYPPGKSFCTDSVVAQLKGYDKAAFLCKDYLPPTRTKTITVAKAGHYNTGAARPQGIATKTVIEIKKTTKTITATSASTITCLNSAYTAASASATIARRYDDIGHPAIPKDWDSAKFALACSCLSLEAPTVTVTTYKMYEDPEGYEPDITTQTFTKTKTLTNTVTTNVSAATIVPNGLFYRKYEHSFNAFVENKFTSSFFKDKDPYWTGTLQILTFSSPNWPSGSAMLSLPDGRPAFPSNQSAILFNGFFIAKQTGTYTFSSSKALIDNWGFLWVGQSAYDWNDGSAAYKASRTALGNVPGSYSVKLNAGDAIPLT